MIRTYRFAIIILLSFIASFQVIGSGMKYGFIQNCAEDTIPPRFLTVPQNDSVNCVLDIESAFSIWYLAGAHATVFDTLGEASVEPVLAFGEALSQMLQATTESCSSGISRSFSFYAQDTCDLSSIDTLSAEFKIVDLGDPAVISPPQDTIVGCGINAATDFQNWIDDFAGAIFSDNCNSNFFICSYFYSDNQARSGFWNEGDPSIFPLARNQCDWVVNITFQISDGFLNNTNTVRATFAIIDTISPYFEGLLPIDTTINCSADVSGMQLSFRALDDCDGELALQINDFSNQSDDSSDCSYYEYQINRTYSAEDACGYRVEHTQIINVVDTIVPSFVIPNDITLYCGSGRDTSITGFPIEAFDNCDVSPIISFTDSEDSGLCGMEINRFWQITDACGSSTILPQRISFIDTIAPVITAAAMNKIIICDKDLNLQDSLTNWIDSRAFAQATDDCGDTQSFVNFSDSYDSTDPNSFQNIDISTIDTSFCNIISDSLVFQVVLDFVFYDQCNNLVISEASFSILDTLPPVFIENVKDSIIVLNNNECETELKIPFPSGEDNCVTDELNKMVWIDNQLFIEGTQLDSITLNLSVGRHQLSYILQDCVNLQDTLIQNIEILSNSSSSLTCPADTVVYLTETECQFSFSFGFNGIFQSNCPSDDDLSIFTISNPSDTLLQYMITDNVNLEPSNMQFTFEGLAANSFVSDPILELNIQANLDNMNKRYELLAEDGTSLITIGGDSKYQCDQLNFHKIVIDKILYNQLAVDGKFELILSPLPDDDGSNGIDIEPCGTINSANNTDPNSRIFLTLKVTESIASYIVEGDTNKALDTFPIPNLLTEVILNPGNSRMSYIVNSANGIADTCSYQIMVLDTLAPQLSCQNIEISIDPSGAIHALLDTNLVIQEVLDNCMLDSISFSNNSFDCSMVGDTLEIEITAVDTFGNRNSCNIDAIIKGFDLNPSFISGLCVGDTLKLFSNVPAPPDTVNYIFKWTGPSDFTSNEENPIIENTDLLNSGMYILELTGANNCVSVDSIDIQILTIPKPEISSVDSIYCLGENFSLSASNFVGDLTYEWFRDRSKILESSSADTSTILAFSGSFEYYVRVNNGSCESSFSDTITIQSIDKIDVSITEPFLEFCEGDTLQLLPSVIDSNFRYEWTGPNNFIDQDSIPKAIDSLSFEDNGNFELVVNQGACFSDTSTARIVVFSKPDTPIIMGESTYCKGSPISLKTNNESVERYIWLQDGITFRVENTNEFIIENANVERTGDWQVIVEDANGFCLSDTSDIFQIVVEEELNIFPQSNSPVCVTDSLELQVAGIASANYSWEGPGGFESNEANNTLVAIEGEYIVSVSTPAGCETSATLVVEIQDKPSITALSQDIPNCVNEESLGRLIPSVFPRVPYSYSWSGPNDYSSIDSIALIDGFDEFSNGEYILMLSDGVCTIDTSILVETKSIPERPIIEGDQLVCLGSSFLLNSASTYENIDSFQWMTPRGMLTSILSEINVNLAGLEDSGEYQLFAFFDNCISMGSNTIDVNVIQEPQIPIAELEEEVCEGGTIRLSTTILPNTEYDWRGPNGFIDRSATPEIRDASSIHNGQYQVRISINDCMSDWSTPLSVEVLENPPTPMIEDIFSTFCVSEDTRIELCVTAESIRQGLSYIWQDINQNTIVESQEACIEVNALDNFNSGRNSIFVLSTNGVCSSILSDVEFVEIEALENEPAQTENDFGVCPNDEVTLEANLPLNTSGVWNSPNNNITFQNRNNPTTGVSNLSIGENLFIWVLSTDNCPNYSADSLTVIVDRNFTLSPDSYAFDFNANEELLPLENDNLPINYTIKILDNPSQIGLEIIDDRLLLDSGTSFVGETEIIYEVCSTICMNNCQNSTISLTIGDENDCNIPSIITPNGDGVNDFFVIPCLSSSSYPQNSLSIFNQWGDEVYNSKPYNNNWQGTYNGQSLPVSTYFFILDLGDDSRPKSGFLQLEK